MYTQNNESDILLDGRHEITFKEDSKAVAELAQLSYFHFNMTLLIPILQYFAYSRWSTVAHSWKSYEKYARCHRKGIN